MKDSLGERQSVWPLSLCLSDVTDTAPLLHISDAEELSVEDSLE